MRMAHYHFLLTVLNKIVGFQKCGAICGCAKWHLGLAAFPDCIYYCYWRFSDQCLRYIHNWYINGEVDVKLNIARIVYCGRVPTGL